MKYSHLPFNSIAKRYLLPLPLYQSSTTGIKYQASKTPHVTRLLLIRHLNTFPQTLNLELLTCRATVNVLDVIGGRLEVAGGVVALGEEDVALGARVSGLVDGDGRTLNDYD